MVEQSGRLLFETTRLAFHLAVPDDAPWVHALWTDPRVMRNVGFPNGLPMSLEEVRQDIDQRHPGEFTQLIIIRLKGSGEVIGQCMMRAPDEEGISETDVKLMPAYWGRRFGVEIKRALVDYLFAHTDCIAVQASPNVNNAASIRMQEAVGGVRVGEGVHEFPEAMQTFTTSVHFITYRVYRETWQKGPLVDK